MIFIGLTGGIGSGKSTVMSILAQKGAVTADADSLAKDLMSNDNNLIRAISRRFGPDCWKNGVLQTAVLAKRAFQDPEAQMELNEIVHPALNKYIRNVFIPVYK